MFCRGKREATPDTWTKSTGSLVPRAMTRTSRSGMASSTHLPSMPTVFTCRQAVWTDCCQICLSLNRNRSTKVNSRDSRARSVRRTETYAILGRTMNDVWWNHRRLRRLWVERSNRQRRTSGQCAKCGETNHVTTRCKHPQEVQCRQCGLWGTKRSTT